MNILEDMENSEDFFDITDVVESEETDNEVPAEADDLIEIEEPAEEEPEPEEMDPSLLTNLFDENIVDDISDNEFEEEEEPASDHKDQCSIITKGTTVNGNIVSDCSLNVIGTVNGDIECLGKLTITGVVTGNSIASDIFVNAKRFEGNINSEGTVKIGLGTIVVGDIRANTAVIAGAVKGEVDVKGPVILDSTAIIMGNIKAKSVQMNNGAVLEGFCSLIYADVDIEQIFD